MKTFYNVISVIFQPLLIPTYGMVLLMRMDVFLMLPSLWRWIAVIGTFVFTALLPALPIFTLMRKGEIKDLFISKREERTMPYLFSFLAYVFWSLFIWRTLQFPIFIVGMAMGTALSILVVIFINLKWKISAHLTALGGLTGAVFGVCFRLAINPIWFFALILGISALVALSRIELKAHTPSQTLAGYVIGFLLVFLPCLFL